MEILDRYLTNIRKEYFLEEICTLITDGAHASPPSVVKGFSMASVKDLTPEGINLDTCRLISEKDYSKLVRQNCKPLVNDVLISKDGNSVTEIVCIMKNDLKVVLLSSVAILRPNTSIILPSYLRYFFDNHNTKIMLKKGFVSGTAIPRIILEDFKKVKISLPSKEEQMSVVVILNNINEKIELNYQMNSTLEILASSLFHSWFVRFDPFQEGEFIDSKLGLIPKGWELGKLNEIAAINMGQSPPGESYNEECKGLIFYQGNKDFGFRFPSPRIFTSEPKKIAEENNILISVRAPIGSLNIAKETCCIGRGLAAIVSNENQFSFLYYLMKTFENRWRIYESEGTVFGSLTKSNLESLKFIKPPDIIIQKFNQIVSYIDSKIRINSDGSKILSSLRNLLLPLLLSGKLRIRDSKQFLDELEKIN